MKQQAHDLTVDSTSPKGGVDRTHHSSVLQKLVFSLLHLLILVFCAGLIYFNGITELGNLFAQNWTISDSLRANILFSCIVLYWIRHNITLFYLLSRKVEWGEVFGLIAFFALFEIGLLLLGSGISRESPIELGALDLIAFVLLLLGSFINSYSEIQRKWWKKKETSSGHCYTEGLFKYAMHINYFGDLVLFTGWALLTSSAITLLIPLLMAAMFIFIHIPGLDSYLFERYGDEFTQYSKSTKKLFPYLY